MLATEHALQDPKVQRLIQSEDLSFDVIVMEQFNHDALLMFGLKFNAPIVTISTLGHTDYLDHAMGLITPLSHVPHNLLAFTDRMSFTERCYNVALSLADMFLRRFYYMTKMQQLADEYFNNTDGSYFSHESVSCSLPIRSKFSVGNIMDNIVIQFTFHSSIGTHRA